MRLQADLARVASLALPTLLVPSLLAILLLDGGSASASTAPTSLPDLDTAPPIAPSQLDLESWVDLRRAPVPPPAADTGGAAYDRPASHSPAPLLLTLINESGEELAGVFLRPAWQDRYWGENGMRSGALLNGAEQILVCPFSGECELLIVDAHGRFKAARLPMSEGGRRSLTIRPWGWQSADDRAELAAFNGPWTMLETPSAADDAELWQELEQWWEEHWTLGPLWS